MRGTATRLLLLIAGMLTLLGAVGQADEPKADERVAEYARRVTSGEGFMPWQARDYPSDAERAFRIRVERRKDRMLDERVSVRHPVLITPGQIARAKRNIARTQWAAEWFAGQRELADYIVSRDPKWIDRMIPEASPTNPYGFTCPNCVGDKSQEGVGYHLLQWDYRNPDVIACGACGQEYPSDEFPQTGRLVCPRTGETFTFYLNEQERAHGDPRDGKHAWRWARRPVHINFDGIVRNKKIRFMLRAVRSLAMVYAVTDDPRYAKAVVDILNRFTWCYPRWLYHDYWDTVADADPLYAAWHEEALPLEWKRHPSATAYAKDSAESASMLKNLWGAGRMHPSNDDIEAMAGVCQAYDLVHDAVDADGRALWTDAQRRAVEENFLLEWAIGAEPWIGYGDPNVVRNTTNKAPRAYAGWAALGRVLGVSEFAVKALSGYRAVRDEMFLFDGATVESPGYESMILAELQKVPEALHGFTPAGGEPMDLFAGDPKLRRIYRTWIEQRRPNGRVAPLADTYVRHQFRPDTFELGRVRYPDLYAGALGQLYDGRAPTEYAVFHLDAETVTERGGFHPPELMLPGWMAAWLRNGTAGDDAAMAALTFNFPGNHMQADNLALFYVDGGDTMLGDMGYVGDSPLINWIHSARSHNLVLVDGRNQRYERRPSLELMATSPAASVVEASSTAYRQCDEYRRLVAMLKGPDGRSVLVDIFRVNGGRTHAFRAWSELASSDAGTDGGLRFEAVELPDEPPLPEVGGSVERADVFGRRDVRRTDDPPAGWRAVWAQPERSYRLWMLGDCDAVEAANMPGQERHDDPGRRVRVLDAVRELPDDAGDGEVLASTFVAVHDPSNGDGEGFSVASAELLDVPDAAGANAVAVRIDCRWGSYLLFNEFDEPAEVAGVTFRGRFGMIRLDGRHPRSLFAVGAETLRMGDFGFSGATARWSGKADGNTATAIVPADGAPADLPVISDGCQGYVLVRQRAPRRPGVYRTGYPVEETSLDRITVKRFPLGKVIDFRLPSVRFQQSAD